MLITDKENLQKYTTEHRIWQGIPSIEVTKKGRIFATFYSGGIKEDIGNYAMLVVSDDGVNFSEPVAVVYKENYRCFDPCIWIDPMDRLWFTWSMMPEHGTYAVICDDPDADELKWSEVFFVGHDVMMNKPTVLSTGEWLFPIAVWNDGIRVLSSEFDTKEKEKLSFVYKTIDNGKTFEKLGGADVPNRSFDEHMVVELGDGRLAMYVRTFYGIGVSYSFDGGRTWSEGRDSGLGGPSSRFFIRRLESGRLLFVNNDSSKVRNKLTAFLSEDDGATWKYKLLLDERDSVSYPDGAVDSEGNIYITYDRQRGALLKSFDEVYASAREILYAKFTEGDILAGKLINPQSKLKCIISKLGRCVDEDKNLFKEPARFSDTEFAAYLINNYPDKIADKIFEHYSINCVNMHNLEVEKFDSLVESLEQPGCNKMQIVTELIALVRSISDIKIGNFPVVDTIKKIIMENMEKDLSTKEMARRAGISAYYMMHTFKKATGTTITEYRNAIKMACAKKLLVGSDKSIAEIAHECGFGSSSYFGKVFMQSEHVSPSDYRRMLKNNAK
ncbi:MAG: helix-turn-helix domain-containing protein [Clostridia bacterium]|nr:helix-turn-helix domain-containing protein [Clostridia bacterium]